VYVALTTLGQCDTKRGPFSPLTLLYMTVCSRSCHWRGVDQHSTGHNQQPVFSFFSGG